MADLRAYKPGYMEPAAMPGDQLLVFFNGRYSLFKVAAVEQLPPSPATTINLGAMVASGSVSNFDPSSTFNIPYGVLAQLRFLLLDDALVTVKQPSATTRFATKASQAKVGAFSRLIREDDGMSEIFWLEDNNPVFDASNPTNYALALCRLVFYGWRFLLAGKDGVPKPGVKAVAISDFSSPAEAAAAGQKFTVINEGGFSR